MSGHSEPLPEGYSWPSLGSEGGAVASVAGIDEAAASEEEEEEEGEYGHEGSSMCTQSVGGVGFAVKGGAHDPFPLHTGLKRTPGTWAEHAAHAAPGAAVRPPLTLDNSWNKHKRRKPREPGASRHDKIARRDQVSEMIKNLSQHVPGALPARLEGGENVAESGAARKRADTTPWKPSASRHGRACLLGGAISRPSADAPSHSASSSIIAPGATHANAEAGGAMDQRGRGGGVAREEERPRTVEFEVLVDRTPPTVCSCARPPCFLHLQTPPVLSATPNAPPCLLPATPHAPLGTSHD